jgi:hypothetical protein
MVEKSSKGSPVPQLTIAMPEKAALSIDNSTLAPTPSGNEKSIDLQRDSNLSTPHSYNNTNPFDTDIEAIIPTSSAEQCARKSTTVPRAADCQIWPGQEHWKQKAKAAKIKNRSCTCMARMSKRNRILVKLLIAFLIVGIAVGVGVGVSKPLGAPIWGNPDQHK